MARRHQDLARAFATLGLSPGCSMDDATRTYKSLVSRWHPDRYANDPQGQAEAALRLREINRAFAVVKSRGGEQPEAPRTPAVEPAAPEPGPAPRFGARLTEAERQQIADALRGPSYASVLGGYLYWGATLGLSALLIVQPSRSSVLPRSETATGAGLLLLGGSVGWSLFERWRQRRH